MIHSNTSVFAAALAVALTTAGCGSEESTETPTTTTTTNAAAEATPPPAPAPEPEPVGGPPVLEAAQVPNIGEMLMPRGFTTTQETAASGNYAYDLGDYKSLQVSWESGEMAGAANLAAARRAAGYMASGEVQSAETLENGMHEVITARASDSSSFVLVISANRYVKCFGPTEHLEVLRSICQSAPVPAG